MINALLKFKNKHPFLSIMAIGFLIRIVAVIFSKGYYLNADHFQVVEQAQSWVNDADYLKWLPGTVGNEGPTGHSFFYVGLQYLTFHFFQLFGVYDPQLKMYLVRLFHATLSLLIISFGYRITSLISRKETAYKLALLLAIFWFMPFLSVRNLVEMFSIPFLMFGSLIILRQELIRKKNDPGYHQSSFLVAGFMLGIAFSTRYQTGVYTAGMAIALLILGNWRGMVSTFLGFMASVVVLQGLLDFIVWGKPFAEFIAYFKHNLSFASDSSALPWHTYISTLTLMFIPPVSLMLFWGFFNNWKKNFILFFPVILFFVFITAFPIKQNIFLLPVLPLILVLGISGWEEFANKSAFLKRNNKSMQAVWVFFWAINLSLLLLFTPMYSHKAKVEAMTYLKAYPKLNNIVVEDANSGIFDAPPLFYSGQKPTVDVLLKQNSYADFRLSKDWTKFENQPSFVLFYRTDNLVARVDSLRQIFPELEYETTIKPGRLERILNRINQKSDKVQITIYRNKAIIPEKKQK